MRFLVGTLALFPVVLSGNPGELIEAVFRDDRARARVLIEEGAHFDQSDERGITALGLACQNGNGPLVEFLLKKGASPRLLSGGERPLLIAARTGSAPCVQHLLAAGAPAHENGRAGQTPLMWAAAGGHLEVVKLLLEGAAKPGKTLVSGFDALLFAVRAGEQEVVEVLLDSGLPVDRVYSPRRPGGANMRAGTSPLLLAVENGHLELALALVARGANPNDLRSGFAPLHVLTWVRKAVRGDGPDGIPPPPIDGELGSLEFVRLLVEAGADVNLRLTKGAGGRGRVHTEGQTPFFMAAASGDLALAKILLELGADARINNVDGTTPFLAAVGLGVLAPGEEQSREDEAVAMAEYLLELGAEINHVDRNGETAMHGAAYKASPLMMQFLDEEGAQIEVWNQKNKYGWSPLLIAQGFRPGNFRPIQYSEEAISAIMLSQGVQPPSSPPPPKAKGYQGD